MEIPGKFAYLPIQSDKELENYLSKIVNPMERLIEGDRLRRLRKEYLEWEEKAINSFEKYGIL